MNFQNCFPLQLKPLLHRPGLACASAVAGLEPDLVEHSFGEDEEVGDDDTELAGVADDEELGGAAGGLAIDF